MTFFTADMSFLPTQLLSATQTLTAPTAETRLGNKCHLGGLMKSRTVLAVTSARSLSLGFFPQKSYFTHILVLVVYFTFHTGCRYAHIR